MKCVGRNKVRAAKKIDTADISQIKLTSNLDFVVDEKHDLAVESTKRNESLLGNGMKSSTDTERLRDWLRNSGKVIKKFFQSTSALFTCDRTDNQCFLPKNVSNDLPLFNSISLAPNLSTSMFDIGHTVGTGSYATVCLAKYKNENYPPMALKVLHKYKIIEEQQVDHVKNERCILQTLNHPFIVGFIDSFQDAINVYLVLEYCCGGEMFSYIRRFGKFNIDVATFYIAQVVLAIGYLHSQGVVFRDLKPENILLDIKGHIRLVDFGFAKIVWDKTYTLCGTHEYLAPEVFLRNGHSHEADWWSVGILIYEFLTGEPPFRASDPFDAYNLALENRIKFPKDFNNSTKDFIKGLLTVNPNRRLGGKNGGNVFEHPFFKGLDWKQMLSKQLVAPLIPKVKDEYDTGNYYNYPDVWESYTVSINSLQQQRYFSDF
ncbi:bifunctional Protein kinase-like domain superfamily/Protein kinase domain/AGC-kinase [Babesia duncani]|uniref:Bifunctional Protein kinase-like domain superfamily/Protein kinase domain/AGC-kinase n=1 Tax=Babesia duncani TaxID=323732 RepID=A0AAD9UQC5_9APIC|nr:bifunctional Protein kinase-like domain superfamily/Protein kinase domain/AGC-kinase [Babesia duncani]